MNNIYRRLHIKHNNLPYINFGEDDKNFDRLYLDIGSNSWNNNRSHNVKCDHSMDYPRYFQIVCELIPRKDFNIEAYVSSRYKPKPDTDDMNCLKFELYSGNDFPLTGFVSSIDIKFLSMLPSFDIKNEILENMEEFMKNQNGEFLYTKSFSYQDYSIHDMKMRIDERLGVTDFNHYISSALPFAGKYHKGIDIKDVEQYMFYIGTDLRSKEYITTVSARDVLCSNFICFDRSVAIKNITSLKDDVLNGDIEIVFKNETGDIVYKSVDIFKHSVTSNKCVLTFKRF